jgi:uncharacterized SAM-dependent methyltransferase
MKYLKNTELAEMYKVSEDTITNWVKAARQKKINLQVVEEGKRTYIVNNPYNHVILKNLSEKAKKYKNRKRLKIVTPKEEFYKVYGERQIIDIISNLEINKEIPHKYAYFNGGAHWFDAYAQRVSQEDGPSTLKKSIEALDFDTEYIYSLIRKYKKVNVIDIGPGNSLPVRKFIDFLLSKDKLRKYIAVDISPEMLKVSEKNLRSWFGKDFPFEGHVRDINVDSIQELLFTNTHFSEREDQSYINLVFFIGSTIENQRKYDESLHTIKNSMGKHDLLLLGQVLDSDTSKMHLAFSAKERSTQNSDLGLILTVVDFLNISDDMYEVYRYYDPEERARIISIALKFDVDIKFETKSFKQTVSISSKDEVIVFRHNHHTGIEVINTMNDIGFDLLHATTSSSADQIHVISKIRPI